MAVVNPRSSTTGGRGPGAVGSFLKHLHPKKTTTATTTTGSSRRRGNSIIILSLRWWISLVSLLLVIVIGIWIYFGLEFLSMEKNYHHSSNINSNSNNHGLVITTPNQNNNNNKKNHDHLIMTSNLKEEEEEHKAESKVRNKNVPSASSSSNMDQKCPISSFSQLSTEELYPVAGKRHMVTPPRGDSNTTSKLSLVCCNTTKGLISLLLHSNWAPIGVKRFLTMVEIGYFSTQIALFRCTDACQFGLAGNITTTWTKQFSTPINDDPLWLPIGPHYRVNSNGIKRYPEGFLTYAGSGRNTRSNQFVITLKPNQFMGGGSPWEVPLGELVGKQSFTTIHQFYTGYKEHGPSQKLLRRDGITNHIRTEWPLMDYITECHIVEEQEERKRQ